MRAEYICVFRELIRLNVGTWEDYALYSYIFICILLTDIFACYP